MKEDKRADAIFQFVGRLTTLKTPITVGGSEICGPVLDETVKFLKEQGWETTFKWNHGKGRLGHWFQTQWENMTYRLRRHA